MVNVTVFLLRCGETQAEAFYRAEAANPEEDQVIEYDDSNHSHTSIPDSPVEEEAPSSPTTNHTSNDNDHDRPDDDDDEHNNNNTPPRGRLRLCQRVDPYMTTTGYTQAHQAWTHLLQGLSASTTHERRLAALTAPTKAATGTALLLSTANLTQYTNLRWQLATVAALQAPFAVPVVIDNLLAAAEPEIVQCGGYQAVVQAGLWHCAAAPWNDARAKCPLQHVLKHFKNAAKDQVRAWKEETQLQSVTQSASMETQELVVNENDDDPAAAAGGSGGDDESGDATGGEEKKDEEKLKGEEMKDEGGEKADDAAEGDENNDKEIVKEAEVEDERSEKAEGATEGEENRNEENKNEEKLKGEEMEDEKAEDATEEKEKNDEEKVGDESSENADEEVDADTNEEDSGKAEEEKDVEAKEEDSGKAGEENDVDTNEEDPAIVTEESEAVDNGEDKEEKDDQENDEAEGMDRSTSENSGVEEGKEEKSDDVDKEESGDGNSAREADGHQETGTDSDNENGESKADDTDDSKPAQKPRRCTDLQYLRIEDATNPWTLVDLTQKTNILVDLIDPKRYMTPPRKGYLAPKRQEVVVQPGVEEGVQQAVLWARQTGCDTVILTIGQAAMQELAKKANLLQSEDNLEVPPCSLASLVADVPSETDPSSISLKFHGFFTSQELAQDPDAAIPPYTGPVDVTIPPPEGNDPMTMPVNQWSKFPPPQPENIPADYPDLPPFSQALTAPIPARPRPPQRPAPSSPGQRRAPSSPGQRRAPSSPGQRRAPSTQPRSPSTPGQRRVARPGQRRAPLSGQRRPQQAPSGPRRRQPPPNGQRPPNPNGQRRPPPNEQRRTSGKGQAQESAPEKSPDSVPAPPVSP